MSLLLHTVAVAETPDPLVLLQGVLSVRSQIPASSLVMKQIYRDSLVTNEYVGRVDFDGVRRAFTYPGPYENGAEYRTLFDGERGTCYSENMKRAELRGLADQTAMLLFDLRTLGISTYNNWSDTPQSTTLVGCTSCKYELIGRENVEGRPAWHIRVTVSGGSRFDYWIDETKAFRVYRKDWNNVQTYSYYENEKYPWLPSRVVSKHYDLSGLLQKETIMEIMEAKADVVFPKNRWTILGMGLKSGTDIVDHNLSRSVGVWNGALVVPSADLAPAPQKLKGKTMPRIIIIVFLVVPIALFLFYRNKNKS